jgi:hypothetical protein
MIKKTSTTFSIVFYTLSILVLAYVVWAFTYSYQTISEAIAAGQLIVKDNKFEIVNYYVTNCGQYFIYALLLFAAGWLSREPQVVTDDTEEVAQTEQSEDNEQVKQPEEEQNNEQDNEQDEEKNIENK